MCSIGYQCRLTGFVEHNGQKFFRVIEQGKENANLRDGVVSTTYHNLNMDPLIRTGLIVLTGVPTYTSRCSRGGEEDNCITKELDVG